MPKDAVELLSRILGFFIFRALPTLTSALALSRLSEHSD
jgi:hypothetical protein